MLLIVHRFDPFNVGVRHPAVQILARVVVSVLPNRDVSVALAVDRGAKYGDDVGQHVRVVRIDRSVGGLNK